MNFIAPGYRIGLAGLVLAVTGCRTMPPETLAPYLIQPIEFAGYTVSQIDSPQAAKYLMTQKLKSSGNYYTVSWDTNHNEIMTPHDGFDFLEYPDGRTIRTETVQQYLDACKLDTVQIGPKTQIENQAYSHTTCDMNAESDMQAVRDKLLLMAKAQSSTHSFLNKGFLKDLPLSVLSCSQMVVGGDEAREIENAIQSGEQAGKRLKDYAGIKAMDQIFAEREKRGDWGIGDLGDCTTIRLSRVELAEHSLRFLDLNTGVAYLIEEVARGDFNQDQIEDAVLVVNWKSAGTLGGSYTEIVTRTSLKQKLKVVHCTDTGTY